MRYFPDAVVEAFDKLDTLKEVSIYSNREGYTTDIYKSGDSSLICHITPTQIIHNKHAHRTQIDAVNSVVSSERLKRLK